MSDPGPVNAISNKEMFARFSKLIRETGGAAECAELETNSHGTVFLFGNRDGGISVQFPKLGEATLVLDKHGQFEYASQRSPANSQILRDIANEIPA